MFIKCIVVDDDELSRNVIQLLIEKNPKLRLEGTFETAVSAVNFLKVQPVDIIFLDVKMPKVSGMDFLKLINKQYEIILITSEEKYAVEAFERDVTDYLVKPVDLIRFQKAVGKAISNIKNMTGSVEVPDCIFVRSKQKLIKVCFKNIAYIEAIGDYIAIHENKQKHIIHSTLKNMLAKMPTDKFIRIHRSFVINLDYISEIQDKSVLFLDRNLPIGASYKENLMKRLNLL